MNKQLLSFNVMSAVQSSYAAEGLSDGEFAKKLSAVLKTEVSTARVRQARLTLSIPSNAPENKAERDLVEAKAYLKIVLDDPMRCVNDTDFQDQIRSFLGLEPEATQ